jgi:hypothetical protein
MEIQPGEAFAEFEQGVLAALEMYSNVHRGGQPLRFQAEGKGFPAPD